MQWLPSSLVLLIELCKDMKFRTFGSSGMRTGVLTGSICVTQESLISFSNTGVFMQIVVCSATQSIAFSRAVTQDTILQKGVCTIRQSRGHDSKAIMRRFGS
jgi:hypothetical protein